MSQSYVLDTSVLLNLIRGKELGRQIDSAFGLSTAFYQHTISVVTHGELYVLANRHNWGEDKRKILMRALQELVTVNIDNKSLIDGYVHVETACRNAAGGERKLSHNDMWIAATALVTGQALITTDNDFQHLNGNLIQVRWINPNLGTPKT